jgi:myo-inositol-1(or 4)-monophosphatase
MQQFKKRESIKIETKGGMDADFVTWVDRESEERIRKDLIRSFPGDIFLGEEGGTRSGKTGRRWIVDPLDGTTNYLHGFPMFAVSIALEEAGDLKVAVVYDPVHRECFEAVRGCGAFLNGREIQVSPCRSLKKALVATGFPFREFSRMKEYLAMFESVARGTSGIRRPGSASLDLCYLACGRVDAFWELGLGPWDVAAGSLIIQEAGGRVTDMKGGRHFLQGDIVASNRHLHLPMLNTLQSTSPKRGI